MPGKKASDRKESGLGILQVLIAAGLLSVAMYYVSGMMVNNNRFQAGLLAAEELQTSMDEAQLALRDFNFCSSMLQVNGAIPPPPPVGTPATVGAPVVIQYPNGGNVILAPKISPLASKMPPLANVLIQSVQIFPVLNVGVPTDNNTQYLAEIRVQATRTTGTGGAMGGMLEDVFPIYILLNGGTVQTCFSTQYMEASTNAPGPKPPLTFEDLLCNKPPEVTVTPTPGPAPAPPPPPAPPPSLTPSRFDPWPLNNPPNSTSSYCH